MAELHAWPYAEPWPPERALDRAPAQQKLIDTLWKFHGARHAHNLSLKGRTLEQCDQGITGRLVEADREAAALVAETGDETVTGSPYMEAEKAGPGNFSSRILDNFLGGELPPERKPMVQ